MMLTVQELSSQERNRAMKRRAIYKSLYEGATSTIQRRHDVGETTAMYPVPGCVVGEMPYKPESAIKYITNKLKKGKFEVYVDGSTLFISWKRPMHKALAGETRKKKKKRKKKKQ